MQTPTEAKYAPTEPLFGSAHQALSFAYTFAATQHGTAGAAERQIALQARERYERHPGSGRGLRGLDGAAQAGMILSAVRRLRAVDQAVLGAMFDRLEPARRRASTLVVATAIAAETGQAADWVLFCVARLQAPRAMRPPLPTADRAGVQSMRTVYRRAAEVRAVLDRMQRAAMDQIEEQLQAAGVVG